MFVIPACPESESLVVIPAYPESAGITDCVPIPDAPASAGLRE